MRPLHSSFGEKFAHGKGAQSPVGVVSCERGEEGGEGALKMGEQADLHPCQCWAGHWCCCRPHPPGVPAGDAAPLAAPCSAHARPPTWHHRLQSHTSQPERQVYDASGVPCVANTNSGTSAPKPYVLARCSMQEDRLVTGGCMAADMHVLCPAVKHATRVKTAPEGSDLSG